jgi:hypothetical protein
MNISHNSYIHVCLIIWREACELVSNWTTHDNCISLITILFTRGVVFPFFRNGNAGTPSVNHHDHNIFAQVILYRVAQKSRYRKKSDNSIMNQANELILLSMIEAYSSFISIMTSLRRPFVKYHYWLQQENFTFSQIEKKTIYLTKGLSKYVSMDMMLGYASINDKKIISFA